MGEGMGGAGRLRVGIVFGGRSREREISYAGGRTAYDNLDRRLFEPVPLFIDGTGKWIVLNTDLLYRGSIRDFFPDPGRWRFWGIPLPIEALSESEQEAARAVVGRVLAVDALPDHVDCLLLVVHGPWGEDGVVQGLATAVGVPYTGSGILASQVCLSKWEVRRRLSQVGFWLPRALHFRWEDLLIRGLPEIIEEIRSVFLECGGFVVRPVHQGSSLGVSRVDGLEDLSAVGRAVLWGFFTWEVQVDWWRRASSGDRHRFLADLLDIRTGPGVPLWWIPVEGGIPAPAGEHRLIRHPEELVRLLDTWRATSMVWLRGTPIESAILVEEPLNGQEFSCIVVEDELGVPYPLPPTGIVYRRGVFDYRAKYLPGVARKRTPAPFPRDTMERIREAVFRAYQVLQCEVYARIDGFVLEDGRVVITDPNTTSGMLPSSLLFHQVAYLGWTPTQFLTHLISRSLDVRVGDVSSSVHWVDVGGQLRRCRIRAGGRRRGRVAVLLGGVSSERHISVESGRNVVEKLSASERFEPVPYFLTVRDGAIRIYPLPLPLLYWDNADDILEALVGDGLLRSLKGAEPFLRVLGEGRWSDAEVFSGFFAGASGWDPSGLPLLALSGQCEFVFLALHGRPGEDGTVQSVLDDLGLPYNGSSAATAALTMDKYRTGVYLRRQGFHTPRQWLVTRGVFRDCERWRRLVDALPFPVIAKPVDEGCSQAVVRIQSGEELAAYARWLFDRDGSAFPALRDLVLSRKEAFLVEEEIRGSSVVEITVGVLTHTDPGQPEVVRYEVLPVSEVVRRGAILTLEEKFLAGEGQNITPAVFASEKSVNERIHEVVRREVERASRVLGIHGYARFDAFVEVNRHTPELSRVIFLEVNSLPGLTPATVLFHQGVLAGYSPLRLLEHIIEEGLRCRRKPEPLYPVPSEVME